MEATVCKKCGSQGHETYSILPNYCQDCVDDVYMANGFNEKKNVTDQDIIDAVMKAYEPQTVLVLMSKGTERMPLVSIDELPLEAQYDGTFGDYDVYTVHNEEALQQFAVDWRVG